MQFKNRFKAYLKYTSLLNSWWTQSISERYKSFSKLFSNCFHKVANFESQNMSKSIVVQSMSKCWYKLSAFWLTLTGTIWRNTTWCFAVLDRHTSVFCSSVLSTFFLKHHVVKYDDVLHNLNETILWATFISTVVPFQAVETQLFFLHQFNPFSSCHFFILVTLVKDACFHKECTLVSQKMFFQFIYFHHHDPAFS